MESNNHLSPFDDAVRYLSTTGNSRIACALGRQLLDLGPP